MTEWQIYFELFGSRYSVLKKFSICKNYKFLGLEFIIYCSYDLLDNNKVLINLISMESDMDIKKKDTYES